MYASSILYILGRVYTNGSCEFARWFSPAKEAKSAVCLKANKDELTKDGGNTSRKGVQQLSVSTS